MTFGIFPRRRPGQSSRDQPGRRWRLQFRRRTSGYLPNGPYNSNPTYTYRDNVTKIIGKHNLVFGGLFRRRSEK